MRHLVLIPLANRIHHHTAPHNDAQPTQKPRPRFQSSKKGKSTLGSNWEQKDAAPGRSYELKAGAHLVRFRRSKLQSITLCHTVHLPRQPTILFRTALYTLNATLEFIIVPPAPTSVFLYHLALTFIIIDAHLLLAILQVLSILRLLRTSIPPYHLALMSIVIDAHLLPANPSNSFTFQLHLRDRKSVV